MFTNEKRESLYSRDEACIVSWLFARTLDSYGFDWRIVEACRALLRYTFIECFRSRLAAADESRSPADQHRAITNPSVALPGAIGAAKNCGAL